MRVLASLTPRERVMVIGGGAVLIAALAYQFAWRPLRADLAETRAEIAAYMQVQAAARAADLPAAATTTAPVPRDPPATRITRTAQAAGLRLSRIEPEGDLLNVTLGEVPFEALIGWLTTLEEAENLGVSGIEIDRRAAPGVVSARIALEEL
ncbi:type II secretion system protein GspM [Oceaniglobus trochenteri]|uniref:type II secretion system protein GspM n=1 Tax=Oceaniglobus trochenteri TaxID=2763260 RepID=UPI001CFF5D59|nr:type II secretion system protein M [Oceaniglobus trochenteri]